MGLIQGQLSEKTPLGGSAYEKVMSLLLITFSTCQEGSYLRLIDLCITQL